MSDPDACINCGQVYGDCVCGHYIPRSEYDPDEERERWLEDVADHA